MRKAWLASAVMAAALAGLGGTTTSASAGGLWPLGESVGLGCGVIFHKALAGRGQLPEGVHGPGQLPKAFLDFALQSNAMFPRLRDELLQTAGIDIELERTSLLFTMYDDGDVAFAKPLLEHCPCGQNRIDWLTPDELAKAEPAVTREVRGALRFNGDDQVNPYRLADAFRAAAQRLGATIITHTAVTGIEMRAGRVVAAQAGADRYPCAMVVNAAGAWAVNVGRMIGIEVPVRPVRGQILGTETLPKVLSACLSTSNCYLAQKQHGEIIIGSTTEEVGFDVGTTPEAMRSLAAGAVRAVPSLANVHLKRVWSGLRPGSPDELPILGPVDEIAGYFNACGHFRTGIVTSPMTGLMISELAAGQSTSFPLEPFLFSRFAGADPQSAIVHAHGIGDAALAEMRFTVPEMQCEGCANKIGQALQAISGVTGVDAKVELKQVWVRYESSKLQEQTLKDALHRAGFSAIETP